MSGVARRVYAQGAGRGANCGSGILLPLYFPPDSGPTPHHVDTMEPTPPTHCPRQSDALEARAMRLACAELCRHRGTLSHVGAEADLGQM